MLDSLVRDVRQAARGLRRRPTYAALVAATLALVIGAASAVVAVVNATMLRDLPFPDDDRLVQLFLMPPGLSAVTDRNPLDVRTFVRFRDRLRLVDRVEGIWARDRALGTDDAEPESVTAGSVSPGAFALFGGQPHLGRTFTTEEDRDDARVAVLGYGLWQRRFGSDTAVIGRTIAIDREPHVIIGVMPPSFRMAYTPTELWTPLHASEAGFNVFATFILTYARLAPGVTVSQLRAELAARLPEVIQEAPRALTGWSPLAATLREAQFGVQRTSLLALVGAVLALALLAAANLANLTLAQVAARRAETALRLALGGGRAAILRLHLAEAALLALVGGAAGVMLGAWALPAILALDPTTARILGDVTVDRSVQFAMAGLAALVVLLSTVLPLARELRGDVAGGLTAGSGRTIGSRRDVRTGQWLVAGECALAVVLLACGAVLLSAFERTARINPGFDPGNVLGAQMRLSASAYPTEARRAEVITRVLDRLRVVPGVDSAATTLNAFTPGFAFVTLVDIEGQPTPDGRGHTVQFRRVSPDYFRTMRIARLRGRDFDGRDTLDSQAVAIVSRMFAERYWPGEDPVGRGVRRGSARRLHTVIGVVEDVTDVGLLQAPAPTFYLPFTQNNVAITPVSLVVRTAGDPAALAGAVRAAVLEVDPAQPLDHVTTLEQFLADSLGPQRFRSTLLLVLGVIGLALAAVGIYGVTSRAVGERTRELGLRLALGASSRGIARLVVWQALGAVLGGLSAGVLLAVPAVMALLAALPNVEHAQPWSATAALAILAAAAVAAAAIPARRAVTLDPVVALRAD